MRRSGLLALVLVLVAGTASAGTTGGLYDFSAMLNAPHPFAGASGQPSTLTPSTVPLAPPAQTLRYVPRASGQPAPSPAPSYQRVRPAPVSSRAAQAAAQREPLAAPPEVDRDSGLFSRFYLSFGGGLDFPDDLSGRTAAGNAATTELDDGYFIAMAFGRTFGRNVRAELELSYRLSDYGDSVSGGARVGGNGEQTVTGLLVNGYYDLDLGLPLTPFIGAGAGVAFIGGDDVAIGNSTLPGRDSTEFAYQGIVGVSYAIGNRWHIVVDGRYMGTGDDDVSSLSGGINLRVDL